VMRVPGARSLYECARQALPRGAVLGVAVWVAAAQGAALPPLKPAGRYFVDPAGAKVVLKGCNLGNWLLIEPWMLGAGEKYRDQHAFVTQLETRFGAQRAAELMELYREQWITAREMGLIKSFGFNVVRVPFHYGLLMGEEMPPALRPEAFKWLDRAVDLAEQAGLYVILDLHGAPGGQSVDGPTGRAGVNALWDDAAQQQRTIWLWQRIAERYRERSAVVAYDLLNEPWGDFKVDVRPKLLELITRLQAAVREVDPEKLIYAPGSLRGITFYGNPRTRGWKNVGFTEHFYPGLFGQGPPALETHARFLTVTVPARRQLFERFDVPYLLGEFNVVFGQVAKPEMMRRYFDTFGSAGWSATLWSARLINPKGGAQPDSWYLMTNAEPFALPDLTTATDADVERALRQLGTMPLVADDALRTALTAATAPQLALTDYSRIAIASPPEESLAGWTATDIAAVPAGGTKLLPNGGVSLYGSGSDLWGNHDEFRFLHREAAGDFAVQNRLTALQAAQAFAKAGWMLRDGLEPDAPHVLVHAFTDGRVMLAWRAERGGLTKEQTLAISGLPVGLGMERSGGRLAVRYTDADGQWQRQAVPDEVRLPDKAQLGLIVMSHEDAVLASATFDGLGNGEAAAPPAVDTGPGPLQNTSFETVGDDPAAIDRAAQWGRWGPWFNREQGWKPRRDGNCVLGYHHWQVESPEQSGVFQDIEGLTAGTRCTFSVYACRDEVADGKHGPDSVELRIESKYNGRLLTVASQTYAAKDLATGERWSRLQVTGSLPADHARVLIIVNPSGAGPRDAALKFDAASLRVEPRSAAPVSALNHPRLQKEENHGQVSVGFVGADGSARAPGFGEQSPG
jgi:endoglucanase